MVAATVSLLQPLLQLDQEVAMAAAAEQHTVIMEQLQQVRAQVAQ